MRDYGNLCESASNRLFWAVYLEGKSRLQGHPSIRGVHAIGRESQVSSFSIWLTKGIRFARDFAQLCRLWLKYDREGHLSVTKLGVQIFTTPSISLELVERYNFLTHLLAI